MIQGIGIDTVDINRFLHWPQLHPDQLARIFSAHEITYCLASPTQSAQRFAGRFAVKEAFFKAWNNAFPEYYFPFLTLCKAISLERNDNQIPHLIIHQTLSSGINGTLIPLVSLTHTKTLAVASVFLQFIQPENR
jgi:holo-[acyl-carrier protein] synthase